MRALLRRCLICGVAALLALAGSGSRAGDRSDKLPLADALKKPYSDLFELAEQPRYSKAEFDDAREALKRGRELCVKQFKQRASQYGKEIERLQKQLKDQASRISAAERRELHCKIQNLRALQAQAEMLAKHAIPIAYENRQAKLDLIEQWPAKFKEITAQLETGTYHHRRWGDVEDIGFREIEKDQHKDIKTGQDAIREMRSSGLLPREIEDRRIVDYVNRVARTVSSHSDLKVPLKVTLLDSKEINAFALPGGFLFIERGLLEAVDDEAELAGVIGHELSHVVARHGHKLMTKAQIASFLLQAGQIAAVLFTGGAASFGAYALQYGFYGLGFVLDLNLLGVSRDFELQADQLGVQYTWASGYDPSGFIRFFDKMATTEGYVEGAAWFHDHPPFFDRMIEAEREITFLPKKPRAVVQTSEFEEMKRALAELSAKAAEKEKDKPSLKGPTLDCPAPPVDAGSGQAIETICSLKTS